MKRFLALGSIVALLAACQPSVPSSDGGDGETGPIKVGYVGPLTGESASAGTDILNGSKMKIEEINAAGGIKGHMVELVIEDGRCTGTDAASAAQKLVNVDKVVGLLGGQCSGEMLAVAPIAEAGKIPAISAYSSNPTVSEAGDFVFRDYPSDALKTKAMAAYFAEEGYEKIAMISENTDFATGFRTSLLKDVGAEHFVLDEMVEPGTKDFRTLMARLADMEFDVFFPNPQTDSIMAPMIEQLREQGLEQPIVSHDVGDSKTLLELAPEASEGMRLLNVPTVGEGEFQTKFVEEFGAPQSTISLAAHGYDAAGVLLQAIAAVGTDGSAIRDYWYEMPSYDGVIGVFHFDAKGDVVGVNYVLKEIKGGKIETLRPVEVE